MKRTSYIKDIITFGFFLPILTGAVTGGLVFLFRVMAGYSVELSETAFQWAREQGFGLPILLVGAVVLGIIATLVLTVAPICRGGGIPTSITIVRGYLDFHWIKSLLGIFSSSMLTFLAGMPLGNEGPCVQLGTSVGRGTVKLLARGDLARDRYVMTGGACAGFAAATGAPLSGILWAVEEAQRRFIPMIFIVSSVCVVSAGTVTEVLGRLFHVNEPMFSFRAENVLPLRWIGTAVLTGVVCALIAAAYTRLYTHTANVLDRVFAKTPLLFKICAVFVLAVLVGYFWQECSGSGHGLIDALAKGQGIWYLLPLLLCVRGMLLILANIIGVTGGLFVPTLTLGAIVGTLCFQAMYALGWVSGEYGVVMMTIGIAAFLGAASRTPLTAIAFSMEALGASSNILPIAVGVAVAYSIVEMLGIESFTDVVVNGKIEASREGKTEQTVDTKLVVVKGAFAEGKEIRDLLLPPHCKILSVSKNNAYLHSSALAAGDTLHIYCQTYDTEHTMQMLYSIVGEQSP